MEILAQEDSAEVGHGFEVAGIDFELENGGKWVGEDEVHQFERFERYFVQGGAGFLAAGFAMEGGVFGVEEGRFLREFLFA